MEKPQRLFTIHPDNGIYAIYANNKPLQTPQGRPFSCPTQALAKATIKQLKAQDLQSPLYRLTSFMLEHNPSALADELTNFLDTDLVFYYAATPKDLAQWQQDQWQPVLAWAKKQGISPLETTTTTAPLTQPEKAKAQLTSLLLSLTPSQGTTAFMIGKLAGSTLIGAGVACGVFSGEQAYHMAHTDELYQQNRYGRDEELSQRLEEMRNQYEQIANFLILSNVIPTP